MSATPIRRSVVNFVPVALILAAAITGAVTIKPLPAATDACSNLAADKSLRSLPDMTITGTTTVAGSFSPPTGRAVEGLPSFCRVSATLKPSPVSDVRIEIWLPSAGWNHKLQAVGNGGLAGVISYGALAAAVKAGYASVSTDTGHVEADTSWLPNEEKERDYGYRAIHGMTVAAKAVLKRFYGNEPKRSYFNGCSTGGGQGLGEAQLYPQDFDGILAGAPANFQTRLRAAGIWDFQAASKNPASHLPKEKLAMITAAVLKDCGGQFGSSDGFLSDDPRACRFDPEELLCKSGQDAAPCLTAPQVEAVKMIYGGMVDPGAKQRLWPGLMRGSEAAGGGSWESTGINGPTPFPPVAQFYSMAVLENPNVDFRTIDAAGAAEKAAMKFGYINHTSTDLDAFLRRGGKLLLYHGWADPLISSANTINYYGAVMAAMQQKKHVDDATALQDVEKSARLFMVPGMGHCGGGPGPDKFDGIGALDRWVDQGMAPEKIIASHITGNATTFSRPLCPYPQVAEYSGSGDRKDASTWVCKARPFTYDSSFYADLKEPVTR